MLQQDFERSSAQQARDLGGDVRLKSGGHTCCCSYCCMSRKNGDLVRTAKTTYYDKTDINCGEEGSALFTMEYAHANAHVSSMADTSTDLTRGHGPQELFRGL